jgi:hypothetical protein
MRRWISRTGKVLLALVLSAAAIWWTADLVKAAKRIGPVDERTNERLERLIVPFFSLKEATLEEGIAKFNEALRASKEMRNFKLALWTETQLPAGFFEETANRSPVFPRLEISEKDGPIEPGPPRLQRVSMLLEEVPAGALLRNLSDYFECELAQSDQVIFVIPAKGSFIERRAIFVEFPMLLDLPRTVSGAPVDVSAFFRASGVKFRGGGSAVYHPSSKRLLVRASRDDIDLCDAVVNSAIFHRYGSPSWAEECREWIEYRHQQVADWFYGFTL